MKVLILDDEKSVRDSIELILKKLCPQVSTIRQAVDIETAHEIVQDWQPDIALIDIQLEIGIGFDFVEHYLPDPPFKIIFCTAHEKYSLQAFDYQPVHYLLKPLHTSKLIQAVNKAQQSIQKIASNGEESKEIIIHQGDGTYIPVKIGHIIYIEAEANYSIIYCIENKKYRIRKTLTELENMPLGNLLKRVHKSHIVNRLYIAEYHKTDNFLRLNTQKSILISVSREKMTEVMAWLYNPLH